MKPAYLLSGPSRLAAEAVREALEAAQVGPARAALDSPRLPGDELPWDELVALLLAPSWGGGGRVVTVDEPAGLLARGSGHGRPRGEAAFLAWLSRPTPGVTVVLRSRAPVDARHPVARAIKELGGFVDCRQPAERLGRAGEREAAEWAGRWASARGLRLAPGLAARLVAAVGADLDRLERELEKMALLAEGGAIGEDAFDVVSGDQEEGVFALVDALGARDARRAGRELERILARGESPLGVLALVASQIRIMRLSKELAQAGLGPEAAARRIGANAYRVRRAQEAARRFRTEELARAVEALWQAEWRVKAGEWDDEGALAWALGRIVAHADPEPGG
ncbi:MAG: DNA polymerase III subunit delta [Clostridia bacterium]|nr:DNA polymerase III subunit delta [Clostridia bacterium]